MKFFLHSGFLSGEIFSKNVDFSLWGWNSAFLSGQNGLFFPRFRVDFKKLKVDLTPSYSRKAIQDAQIVIIPYNTLLHSSTREAIDIKLENSVVIIDEAHNVLETIGKNKIKNFIIIIL